MAGERNPDKKYIRQMINLKPEEDQFVMSRLPKNVLFATWAKDIVMEAARNEVGEATKVPLLGYIPGGPEAEIRPFPVGATVRPPFKLGKDCYALAVIGDSMEADTGLSIEDGSYAFFCPDAVISYGAIVHAEFPAEHGDRTCSLKKYCPLPDGRVSFQPLNKKHKAIIKNEGEFIVRGSFVRAWDGTKPEPKP